MQHHYWAFDVPYSVAVRERINRQESDPCNNSWSGQVGRFKRGALQIALDLKLPIVPISLSGCYEVMNRHEVFANYHPVHMHIGKPIDISTLAEENIPTAIEQLREAVIEGMDK